jgi:hypothetical protein
MAGGFEFADNLNKESIQREAAMCHPLSAASLPIHWCFKKSSPGISLPAGNTVSKGFPKSQKRTTG